MEDRRSTVAAWRSGSSAVVGSAVQNAGRWQLSLGWGVDWVVDQVWTMSAEVERYVENCPQVIGEARPGAQQRSAARGGRAALRRRRSPA